MKTFNIGLVGCGTVGTGVAKILLESKEVLRARVGADLDLLRVADIDVESDRGIRFEDGVLTTDAKAVVDDPKIDIVVEMIGGEKIAKDLILRAVENGKHVVTANKALLAAQGTSIFHAAAQKGVDLAFEASVGGCMPIIKTLRESLVGNRIKSMTGILNGTCNYIFTKITEEGITFDAALSDAQEKGYAEADPALDVEGLDTAHKLAILTAIAYGTEVSLNDIYIEGISNITPMDIRFAEQFGYKIKLLAISKYLGDRIEARVHPTMIASENPLSNVSGTLNAITVSADAAGNMMLYGHGAGMMPTASAVVGDVVDLVRNLMCGSPGRVPLPSYPTDKIRKIPILPIDEIQTQYYFRLSALDRPGVLSTVTGVLGQHGISIKSVHQKGRKASGSVPIVMLSHLAKESNVKQAISEIADLDVVRETPVLIRIEDEIEEV
jgi:homoserine dehydrogenase